MQLFKFLKIFFRLYLRFLCRPVTKYILCTLFIAATQKTNAQNPDTNYVDTVSIAHIDSIAASSAQNTESAGYDDEDDGYVDTTVKHIYDTSKLFFNWKDYKDAAYTKEKI